MELSSLFYLTTTILVIALTFLAYKWLTLIYYAKANLLKSRYFTISLVLGTLTTLGISTLNNLATDWAKVIACGFALASIIIIWWLYILDKRRLDLKQKDKFTKFDREEENFNFFIANKKLSY